MAEKTDVRKLLVLRGPAIEAQGIVSILREHFDVQIAEQYEDALEAMRTSSFSAVLAETADFLPLERGIVTQQAAVVLETIGDGVCVAGADGRTVWANRRIRDLPEDALARLREMCAGAYEQFSSAGQTDPDGGRRFSMMPPGGKYYEVICSPIRDRRGQLRQVVAAVIDATSQRRGQLKLNAIDRAGRELVSLEHHAVAQRDATERLTILEDRILSCSRDVLNYEHFAVLLLDGSTNRLDELVSEGLDGDGAQRECLASVEGNGICGYVAATGRSYICPDARNDSRYLPGFRDARSSLTVPLRLHDRVVGVLNVESRQLAAFTEEDRQFAEIFANYLALAMHILNLLATERHKTTTQVSGSISADLAGPINDIVAEASELMEDYIGHDDLRKRLQSIIDRAWCSRKLIHDLTEPAGTGALRGASGQAGYDRILAGKNILVADDEEPMRLTIRDVLASTGASVDAVADGAQAVKMLSQKTYDLIISDIKMPSATGYEVFAAAKEACPDTQVILITGFGYDPNHSIIRAGSERLAAVLMKPFKANKLLFECRAALSAVGR